MMIQMPHCLKYWHVTTAFAVVAKHSGSMQIGQQAATCRSATVETNECKVGDAAAMSERQVSIGDHVHTYATQFYAGNLYRMAR